MSTGLEAIAARQPGAEVLGLSLVTNLAAGMTGGAGSTTRRCWQRAVPPRPGWARLLGQAILAAEPRNGGERGSNRHQRPRAWLADDP